MKQRTGEQVRLTRPQAEKIILQLTIDRLRRDTYASSDISADNQGELVRASNQIANRLQEWLTLREREG